jgi:hypothetical protein
MAIAMPPSVIRFSVWPKRAIPKNVVTSATGTESAARKPARQFRRKSERTPTVSSTPMAIASRMPRIDSWISPPWL